MSYDNAELGDAQAEICHTEHTGRREMDCTSCDIRAELVHCATCGADYVDGRWYTALGSTTPNGCDHESLVDDWGNEIRCVVMVTKSSSGPGHYLARCGDAVSTPGKTACTFHQQWLDAEECAAVYQRLVAAR